MKRKLRVAMVVGVFAAMAVAALAPPAHADATDNHIRIQKFMFIQNLKLIFPGEVVSVTNTDGVIRGIPHSLTSKIGLFDTEPFTTGTRYITAPAAPGVYRYFCEIHNFMKGQLTVSSLQLAR